MKFKIALRLTFILPLRQELFTYDCIIFNNRHLTTILNKYSSYLSLKTYNEQPNAQ